VHAANRDGGAAQCAPFEQPRPPAHDVRGGTELRTRFDEPALHAEPERTQQRQKHEPRHTDHKGQQRAVDEERPHGL
jgi:hypothetical protein